MNFTEYCDICGQQLTDASGRWSIAFMDRGIYHRPTEKMKCCTYCHDGITKKILEYVEERREEREPKSR